MNSLSFAEPIPSSLDLPAVDVAVVGGGIIGLGIAWTLAQTGRSVCIIDPDPAMGATRAAAGMLAPVSEYHYQEEVLLELTLESSRLYPDFIRNLEELGKETGYLRTQTLLVGVDAGDRSALGDIYQRQILQNLPVVPLTVRELRNREPLFSPQLSSAYLIADDHQVDPRILASALLEVLAQPPASAGLVYFDQRAAKSLLHTDQDDLSSAVRGINFEGGGALEASEVILANGLGASKVQGLPPWLHLPLRPVYGDIIRVAVPENLRPLVGATIRGMVHGNSVYIVPRNDGTAVIGATQRETGTSGVSAGGIFTLLRDAQELLPAIAEAEIVEIMARPRPGTPDNKPLLGRVCQPDGSPLEGLIIATGFFRHGVLLTPVAAEICKRLVNGESDAGWEPFSPDRFSFHPTYAVEQK